MEACTHSHPAASPLLTPLPLYMQVLNLNFNKLSNIEPLARHCRLLTKLYLSTNALEDEAIDAAFDGHFKHFFS